MEVFMKILLKIVLILIPLSEGTAMAANLMLERSTYAGFTLPQDYVTTNCKVYDDGQIDIEKQVNNLKSIQNVTIKLTTKDAIKSAIMAAEWGNIIEKRPPLIEDLPSSLYQAYYKQANNKLKTIFLWEGSNFPGQYRYNDSEAAASLKNFLDLNCEVPLGGIAK